MRTSWRTILKPCVILKNEKQHIRFVRKSTVSMVLMDAAPSSG